MAKVFPGSLPSSTSTSSSKYGKVSCNRETFTIWLKSLVLNGNGCTVFDSNGDIVYRIDNYDNKHNDEVHLMDLQGKVLCTILRKKFSLFGCWEGFKLSNEGKLEAGQPWFQSKIPLCRIFKGDSCFEVIIGCEKEETQRYQIRGCHDKVACKIVDQAGVLIGEVKRKESASGIALGDDVMTLVVEPNVDHSLIMSFVIVYNLTNHKM